MMLGLLIAIIAATFGVVITIVLLVAWGIRREDAWLTMGSPAPDRLTHAVRRLNGLYTLGIAAPGQDQSPGTSSKASFTVPSHIDYDSGALLHSDTLSHPDPRTTEPV
ncbi:MAG TPA: hypothetical protein VGH27_05420 [Streptosporangiaceae bacterium]|jgi:hypothetical protein